MFEGRNIVITCPVRLRQDWLIAEDAAAFFFPAGSSWTSLTEIRINDKHGRSAGNIDIVLVQNRYQLVRSKTVYTQFGPALDKITTAEPGDIQDFIDYLQEKLDDKLITGASPDTPTLLDALNGEGV